MKPIPHLGAHIDGVQYFLAHILSEYTACQTGTRLEMNAQVALENAIYIIMEITGAPTLVEALQHTGRPSLTNLLMIATGESATRTDGGDIVLRMIYHGRPGILEQAGFAVQNSWVKRGPRILGFGDH